MGRPLRVLTANLFSGRARIDAVCRAVDAGRIDLACLQELNAPHADALRQVLPYGRLAPNGGNRGLGIASRFPVEVEPLPIPHRPGWVAQVNAEDWDAADALQVACVHMAAPHTWPYFPRRVRRRHQWKALEDFLETSSPPVAMLGDFNATPIWPLYRRIAARSRDAAREANAPSATWPNLGPRLARLGLAPFWRIDHCFLTGPVVCVRAERIDLPGSDHWGLCVDLRSAPSSPPVVSAGATSLGESSR